MCPAVSVQFTTYSASYFRPPAFGQDLELRYFDGADWLLAQRVAADGVDRGPKRISVVIEDPEALWGGLQLEISAPDDWWIDDVWVTCTEPDGDGDGYGPVVDCDDTDARHHSDCTTCVDLDDDGFGDGCDLGEDCDDFDSLINPDAMDIWGDGDDTDCSGEDGPSIFDDFDQTALSIRHFQAGNAVWSNFIAPLNELRFSGAGYIETASLDLATCSAVQWRYGLGTVTIPGEPAVFWDDGAAWVAAPHLQIGDDVVGLVDDPAALTSFNLRLESTRYLTIDYLGVRCVDADGDGDGVSPELDCDDNDPLHWADCGVCIDLDGDGFGEGCDLGDDCDDTASSINPNAVDTYGDGIDDDCTGLDGSGWFFTFEQADEGWAFVGDAALSQETAFSGIWSANLAGGNGTLVLPSWDTTFCTALDWSFRVQRGPDVPETTDSLEAFFYDSGFQPISVVIIEGDGTESQGFETWTGTITDPDAFVTDFQLRFLSEGSGRGFDDFYIDDINVVCR